jgi:predicted ATP-binding protein involved in virulence
MRKNYVSKKSKSENQTISLEQNMADGSTLSLPPSYFLSVEVENARCFANRQKLNLSVSDGRPAQWTVILGDNGVGKTTLLQCLAALEPLPPSMVNSNAGGNAFPKLSSIHLNWQPYRGSDDLMTVSSKVCFGAKLKQKTTPQNCEYAIVATPKQGEASRAKYADVGALICYGYGAARRIGQTGLSGKDNIDTTASLFNNDVPLRNAEEWLLQLDYTASKPSPIQKRMQKRCEEVKSLLVRLLPDVEEINFSRLTERRPKPSVKMRTPYGWVSIHDLSLGYKTLIAWMVDFASRMYDRYPQSSNPIAEPAIVLVDEIDLHLHPSWQRNLMRFLTDHFVNTQFIVTSHSPLIVQAASKANIVLLRREDDHVVIDNDVSRIWGWRVDQVLTSDLFGLQSARPPELDKLLAERNKILSKGKITKADRTRLLNLEKTIGPLPAGETSEDIRAMDIIRRAAELLEEKI